LFTAASRLTLPFQEGKSEQPFYCRASHPEGTRVVKVENPGECPTLTIHPPSRDDFDGPYRNSSILCQIRGAPSSSSSVRWLKNGLPLTTGVVTETPARAGASVTNSWATVTETEWDGGAVYTCQLGEELRNTSKALECG
ncbi:IGHM protein, partial [Sula dactylatra]|nr:IGHM protein [Sula dactylatra]